MWKLATVLLAFASLASCAQDKPSKANCFNFVALPDDAPCTFEKLPAMGRQKAF